MGAATCSFSSTDSTALGEGPTTTTMGAVGSRAMIAVHYHTSKRLFIVVYESNHLVIVLPAKFAITAPVRTKTSHQTDRPKRGLGLETYFTDVRGDGYLRCWEQYPIGDR